MHSNMSWETRFLEIVKKGTLICLSGLGYAFFMWFTDISIPCPIHTLTGFYCPGCGITRMCLSLLQLDFATAWRANPALLVMLPVFAVLVGTWSLRYVKTGKRKLAKWQNLILWGCIVLLVVFGILRNLPWFVWMAPH